MVNTMKPNRKMLKRHVCISRVKSEYNNMKFLKQHDVK